MLNSDVGRLCQHTLYGKALKVETLLRVQSVDTKNVLKGFFNYGICVLRVCVQGCDLRSQ